jgi:hypothetical protein
VQEEEAQALGPERQEEELQEKEAPLSAQPKGEVQMIRKALFASLLAGAAVAMASPAAASAATTLGETFAPTADLSCGGPNYQVVQAHRASGISYAAPSAGVITSWSFQASATQPTTLTMEVFRPTGTPQEYLVAAQAGAPRTVTAGSGVNTFLTGLPVQTGDFIGIHSTDGPCASMSTSTSDVYDAHLNTTVPVGMSAVFSEGFEQIFDISAKLEPDCDKDGLGDETQDPDVTIACPTPPPPGTGGSNGQPTTTKRCKKKHKKHKRSAQSAKKKKKCKKKKRRH